MERLEHEWIIVFGVVTCQCCGVSKEKARSPCEALFRLTTSTGKLKVEYRGTTMINKYKELDKKVYSKHPSKCKDCARILEFTVRSNKRCEDCYKAERRKKDDFVFVPFEW